MIKRTQQHGFNLIELMVAIVLGILVLTAVTSLFISMIRADADNMKMTRLNQELRAAMSLMTRDIRRAGGTGGTNWNSTIFSTIYPNTTYPATSIRFSYDQNQDGVLQASENMGYMHYPTSHSIKGLSSGVWSTLTDTTVININTLTFRSICTAIVTPGTIFMREIEINLIGSLTPLNANDPNDPNRLVKRTMQESVKIRNDNINKAGTCF